MPPKQKGRGVGPREGLAGTAFEAGGRDPGQKAEGSSLLIFTVEAAVFAGFSVSPWQAGSRDITRLVQQCQSLGEEAWVWLIHCCVTLGSSPPSLGPGCLLRSIRDCDQILSRAASHCSAEDSHPCLVATDPCFSAPCSCPLGGAWDWLGPGHVLGPSLGSSRDADRGAAGLPRARCPGAS